MCACFYCNFYFFSLLIFEVFLSLKTIQENVKTLESKVFKKEKYINCRTYYSQFSKNRKKQQYYYYYNI